MAKNGNKYKIGALALAAIVILVLGLLSLGVMKYFQPEILFMTSTESSVQGLKVGSNVKIKGVTIGSVNSIKIGLEASTIFITMKFDLNTFLDQSQAKLPIITHNYQENFNKKVDPMIAKGLRCQLQYEGITGDMYVDIAYFDPKEYPVILPELPENHPLYLPLIPSPTIGNILQTTQDIAKKLNDIDIKKIIANFDDLVLGINDFTNQLKEIANKQKINTIGDNINYSLNRFDQTMNSINALVKTIQKQPDSVVWGKVGSKVVPSLEP
ncbi:MAG: MlaD family protein [Lentisphaerota bacterium]